jgi:hypothetical protein
MHMYITMLHTHYLHACDPARCRLSPGAVSDEDARRHLKAGNLEPLVAADQLRLEMSGGWVCAFAYLCLTYLRLII